MPGLPRAGFAAGFPDETDYPKLLSSAISEQSSHGEIVNNTTSSAWVLWLLLLLGLRTMDPMTRAAYIVQGTGMPR
jgi:hypothetical protein